VSKQSLLLVDGDTRSLRVLEVSLRKAGFMVTAASSVQDALDKLELHAPDLIISETTFPDGDGFELRRRVRATPDWAEIPFIFLTAEAAIENKIRGLELGVDDYLTKPIYIKEIVTRINILLQKRQRVRFEERRDGRTRFTGRVQDMPVVDVIQTIEISRKSGVIQFVGERGRQAAIYFRDGRVIDAEAGSLQGEDAVYRLLTWSEGEFEVVFRTVRRREVIAMSSQALLMEGMRRLDEWSRLFEQLPPLTHRFEVDTIELAARLGDVPDDNNRILRLFDGKRTLLEVIDASDVGDLECLQAISRLYFEELLLDLDHGKTPRRDTGKSLPLVESDALAPMEDVASGPHERARVSGEQAAELGTLDEEDDLAIGHADEPDGEAAGAYDRGAESGRPASRRVDGGAGGDRAGSGADEREAGAGARSPARGGASGEMAAVQGDGGASAGRRTPSGQLTALEDRPASGQRDAGRPASGPLEALDAASEGERDRVNGPAAAEGGRASGRMAAVEGGRASGRMAAVEGGRVSGRIEAVEGGRVSGRMEAVEGGRVSGRMEAVEGGRASGQQAAVEGGRASGQQAAVEGGRASGQQAAAEGGRVSGRMEAVESGRVSSRMEAVEGGRPSNRMEAVAGRTASGRMVAVADERSAEADAALEGADAGGAEELEGARSPANDAAGEDERVGPLLGGYRPSSLRLIDEAVAAAQAIEPSLFEDAKPDEAHAGNGVARTVTPQALAEEPRPGDLAAGRPAPLESAAHLRAAEREESGLRMIGSLGRDRAEASGELAPLGRTRPLRSETARELVTILPRRVTRELPAISQELAESLPTPTPTSPVLTPRPSTAQESQPLPAARPSQRISLPGTGVTTAGKSRGLLRSADGGPGLGPLLLILLAIVLAGTAVMLRLRRHASAPPRVEDKSELNRPSAMALPVTTPEGGAHEPDVRRPDGARALEDGSTPGSPAGSRPAVGADAKTGGVDAKTGGADAKTGGADAKTGGADAKTGGVDAKTGGVDAKTGGVDAKSGGADSKAGAVKSGGTDSKAGAVKASGAEGKAGAVKASGAEGTAGEGAKSGGVEGKAGDGEKLGEAKALYDRAHDALDEGDAAKAFALAEASLRLRKTARTYLLRAQAEQRLDRVDAALASVNAAAQIAPQFGSVWELQGRILWAARRRDEARVAFEKFLALEPTNPRAASVRRLINEPR
jgi:CheY-like chemotaxis protein